MPLPSVIPEGFAPKLVALRDNFAAIASNDSDPNTAVITPNGPQINLTTGGTITLGVADRLWAARFTVPKPLTVAKIKFVISTADALDGGLVVGICDGATGTRLTQSGSATGIMTTTGTKEIGLGPYTLVPGTVYYAYIQTDIATAAVVQASSLANSLNANLLGAAMPHITGGLFDPGSYPVSSAIGPLTANAAVPRLAITDS